MRKGREERKKLVIEKERKREGEEKAYKGRKIKREKWLVRIREKKCKRQRNHK